MLEVVNCLEGGMLTPSHKGVEACCFEAQMRSILRMVCLISSFGEDQKEKLQK